MNALADRSFSGRALHSFNLVLVCENFPVGSVDLTEITFRGRKFHEEMRLGPALQASTKNVQLLLLPDRVQVNVSEPDDLGILVAGVGEVVKVIKDYIGRRAVTAVGHNVQAFFTEPGGNPAFHEQVVRGDAMRELVGMTEVEETSVTVIGRRGKESALRVTTATEVESQRGMLDMNFDFQLRPHGVAISLDEAVGELEASLRHAVDITETFARAATSERQVKR